jgi:type IV pilus assembly protein PilQ
LDLKVNKDSVGQVYNNVPSINTNKVSTQVLVENGGTVVIGGVYSQSLTDSDNKVPWLGDLPIIGFLFKSTSKIDNKNELLVFITPKIMKDTLNLK